MQNNAISFIDIGSVEDTDITTNTTNDESLENRKHPFIDDSSKTRDVQCYIYMKLSRDSKI